MREVINIISNRIYNDIDLFLIKDGRTRRRERRAYNRKFAYGNQIKDKFKGK